MENEGFNGRCVALLASLRARSLILRLTYIFVRTLFSSSGAYLTSGWRSLFFLSSISASLRTQTPGTRSCFFLSPVSLVVLRVNGAGASSLLGVLIGFLMLGFCVLFCFVFLVPFSPPYYACAFHCSWSSRAANGRYNDVYEMQ